MNKVEPTLTVRALLPLMSGLRNLGYDPAPMLRAVGVDTTALANPDERVPMSAGSGLLTRAAAVTGDDCIGLHLAEHADLRTVDVHYFAMAASATLRSAYERLSRYQHLIHETSRIDHRPHGAGLAIRHVLPGGLAAPRHTAEFLIAAWVRTGRFVTGTDWSPLEVRFAHAAPLSTREHERFFRAPLRFTTGENALVVSEPTLALPCVQAEPALAAFFDRHAAEHTRHRRATPPSLPDRVRDEVRVLLRDSTPGATGVAARLKMSVRTLNRALAGEGTSYREVLNQLRHELACGYLADPHISTGEVAFLLGFSELSAFYRAFRRWTGTTPLAFRHALQADRAASSDSRRH
jgi:AraC-like DNA-binding protein